MNTGLYRPYKKAINNPTYVHTDSNHPMHVKKELPQMIGRRISDLSANQEVFNAEAAVYNNALRLAGYNNELQYTENLIKKRRPRKKKVTWFNPPWNDEVSTNIAKKFLCMIDRHFPKNTILGKHLNRSTIKVSYSSMPNMARIISGHNKKVIGSSAHLETKGCNCRKPPCPLDGKCKTTNLLYRGTVKTANFTKHYVGLSSNSFKERYTGHKASFTHRAQANKTTLSNYIWNLRDKQTTYDLEWSILNLAPSYSRKVRNCQLCLMEKTLISLADPSTTLNKRNEIIAKCRHRDKVLLKNW